MEVSSVKRPPRRQKAAVKYDFGADDEDMDENVSRDDSGAEEDWMEDDDDSDFDI